MHYLVSLSAASMIVAFSLVLLIRCCDVSFSTDAVARCYSSTVVEMQDGDDSFILRVGDNK